jgi:hypothetical protein
MNSANDADDPKRRIDLPFDAESPSSSALTARPPSPCYSPRRLRAAAVAIAYAVANLRLGRSISQSTIAALTTFQIKPLRNATR